MCRLLKIALGTGETYDKIYFDPGGCDITA